MQVDKSMDLVMDELMNNPPSLSKVSYIHQLRICRLATYMIRMAFAIHPEMAADNKYICYLRNCIGLEKDASDASLYWIMEKLRLIYFESQVNIWNCCDPYIFYGLLNIIMGGPSIELLHPPLPRELLEEIAHHI